MYRKKQYVQGSVLSKVPGTHCGCTPHGRGGPLCLLEYLSPWLPTAIMLSVTAVPVTDKHWDRRYSHTTINDKFSHSWSINPLKIFNEDICHATHGAGHWEYIYEQKKFMPHEVVAQEGKYILKIMKNKNGRERQIL